MRIGVDLRSLEAGSQNRGIGRYVGSVLQALSEHDHVNEYVLFVSSRRAELPDLKLHGKLRQSRAHGRPPGLRGLKYVRILFIGPRPLPVDKHRLDVFFHVDPTQPIRARATPVVSVLYDLIPYLPRYKARYQHVHLGGYTPGHLIGYSRIKLHWRRVERSVQDYRRAARVISISEHSKRDLVSFIPSVTPDKVVAIPLAGGQLPAEDKAAAASMKKLGLKKFLFYVGGADPRKGLVGLTEAMEEVWQRHPDVQLVMAGKEITDPDVPEAVRLRLAAEKSSRPKQIIRLGFISDGELAWLYHHAAAFVFPSEYEGFGLPVLEAMQAGCPVIAYDNSSIPEVAGQAALLVSDGESLVPAITKVLGDKKLRDKLIADGKKQAAKFTWEKTAKETLRVLREAAR
jgi:glycosyltransferase involved in cell wall biosynthesis